MPTLTFILPHWMYWSGLVVFPLVALYLLSRPRRAGPPRGVSLPVAYLMWLTAGYLGIHRFYVRSYWGVVYIPLFIAILFSNVKGRAARDSVSFARNEFLDVEFDVERFQKAVADGVEGAVEKLAKAQEMLAAANEQFATAATNFDYWDTVSGGFALVIALALIIDAVLLPGLTRRCAEREEAKAPPPKGEIAAVAQQHAPSRDPVRGVHSLVTDAIDTVSGWVGHFVCFWSVIAVFVYYYEVLARYVFNSPTNWAHESMFLLFGMQYLLSGAFAYREDAHVRVDVIYVHLPDRAKAAVDVFTSVFFFIFTGALLWTGWIFLMDSAQVWEVSFTEWAIQYWPVKATLAIGALLIILQGLSKLIKDIHLLTRQGS
ncbi:MAG: TRAP transporter small permease subunit [Proteobacteria bacterium]|nr:TRAP transporter small permease subunit [Pseudomonadota bacterium]